MDEFRPSQLPTRRPVEALRLGLRSRLADPLDDPVWKLVLLVAAGSVLSSLLRWPSGLGPGLRLSLDLLVVLFTWVLAVRLLLLDSRGPRFWRIWLLLGLLGLAVVRAEDFGPAIAIAFGVVFLLVRRYRPYRHLSSLRRAKAFFLGLFALVFFAAGRELESPESGLGSLFYDIRIYAGVMLALFWSFSLLRLFLGMRLHFMRLKPKLAVTTMLLALVPLVLVVVLASIALYGALGGGQASQTTRVLYQWAEIVDQDPNAGTHLFPTRLRTEIRRGEPASDGEDEDAEGRESSPLDPPQPWMLRLLAAADSSATVPTDTTAYVDADGDGFWLCRVRGFREPVTRIDAFAVDESALQTLSRLIGSEVEVYRADRVEVDNEGNFHIRVGSEDAQPPANSARIGSERVGSPPLNSPQIGSAGTDSLSANLAQIPGQREPVVERRLGLDPSAHLYFGGATMEVLLLRDGRLEKGRVLIALKTQLRHLLADYVSGENEFNKAVVIMLAAVASIFLVLEGFALFFGLRITSSIVSAVRSLHRGTERLARGDLDTHLELPNEDEFGDLAASFNEMTAAIRLGQEEAMLRERLEQEIELARRIQQRLLPRETPVLDGFELAGTSIPSRQVGGDYYDFLKLTGQRLGIAVGDVSGKGIPAAMLMANLQASLQGQVIHPSSVGSTVSRINDLLAASTDPHMFATFVYGELDEQTHTLTLASAGHDPPIVCRRDGSTERLGESGLVLGMLPGQGYQETQIEFTPGDVLVLFTDGVTEASGPSPVGEAGSDPSLASEDFFGENKLIEVIRQHAHRSATEIRDAVLEAISAHTRGAQQSDDITLVVLKRIEAG